MVVLLAPVYLFEDIYCSPAHNFSCFTSLIKLQGNCIRSDHCNGLKMKCMPSLLDEVLISR